jgi:hypothetical protein
MLAERFKSSTRTSPSSSDEELGVGMMEHKPSEGGVALADLARLRFAPTTSLRAGGVMPPSRDRILLKGPPRWNGISEKRSDKTEPLKTS